jgi:excisionase family DNA binding protein
MPETLTIGPDVLHVTDVAEALQISRSSVYGLINSKELKSILVGSSRRIPMKSFQRYLESIGYEGRYVDVP